MINTAQKPTFSEALDNLKLALAANVDWEISCFDVKHLNDLAHGYRLKVQELIRVYRAWEKVYSSQRDVRALLYGRMEGDLILQQIRDARTMYKEVRTEAAFLTEVYIGQCKKR